MYGDEEIMISSYTLGTLIIGFAMVAIVVTLILFVVSYYDHQQQEQDDLDIFKNLVCEQQQSYLLNNDYWKSQKEHYMIKCGTIPIGDLET